MRLYVGCELCPAREEVDLAGDRLPTMIDQDDDTFTLDTPWLELPAGWAFSSHGERCPAHPPTPEQRRGL